MNRRRNENFSGLAASGVFKHVPIATAHFESPTFLIDHSIISRMLIILLL